MIRFYGWGDPDYDPGESIPGSSTLPDDFYGGYDINVDQSIVLVDKDL